jgi:hypothetical protein
MPLFNNTLKRKYYVIPVVEKRNMSMNPLWNASEWGNSKYSDRNLSHCSFVHSKSRLNWPGIEPELKKEGRYLNAFLT